MARCAKRNELDSPLLLGGDDVETIDFILGVLLFFVFLEGLRGI